MRKREEGEEEEVSAYTSPKKIWEGKREEGKGKRRKRRKEGRVGVAEERKGRKRK